jgi:hypothetical protein
MDSWWNPAVEYRKAVYLALVPDRTLISRVAEAMDRIHRLGQRRPVQAIKLVVEDSIESRIVQVSVFTALDRASRSLWNSCKKRNRRWSTPLYVTFHVVP